MLFVGGLRVLSGVWPMRVGDRLIHLDKNQRYAMFLA